MIAPESISIIILGLEILLAGLFIGSRQPIEQIYGIDVVALERTGVGLWGAFLYSSILTVFRSLPKAHLSILPNANAILSLLASGAFGFVLFCILDNFLFSKGDLRRNAIAVGLAIGIPIAGFGFLILTPLAAGICVVVGGLAALGASVYIGEEYISFSSEGRMTIWVTIWVVGAIAGAIVGDSEKGTWGGIIGSAVGIVAVAGLVSVAYGVTWTVSRIFCGFLTFLLTIIRFKKVICNNCYRYSFPLKSAYSSGERLCENCDKEMDYSRDPGRVIMVFGNYPVDETGRKFIFKNPDFAKMDYQIDVTDTYIDSKSADPLLIEQFVTHVRELFPPRYGVDSIRVYHRGSLATLGANIDNLIVNNFEKVQGVG